MPYWGYHAFSGAAIFSRGKKLEDREGAPPVNIYQLDVVLENHAVPGAAIFSKGGTLEGDYLQRKHQQRKGDSYI
jgi:hypothetical protein